MGEKGDAVSSVSKTVTKSVETAKQVTEPVSTDSKLDKAAKTITKVKECKRDEKPRQRLSGSIATCMACAHTFELKEYKRRGKYIRIPPPPNCYNCGKFGKYKYERQPRKNRRRL